MSNYNNMMNTNTMNTCSNTTYIRSTTLITRTIDLRCRNPSLGLVTKERGLQGCGPRLSLRVAFSCPWKCKRIWGKNPHTPKWTPTLGVGIRWVIYIIRKLLKRRCLKWVRITHLDIWNTSYGQKKSHLDVSLMEKHRVYYKGEGGGFPQIWAVVSLVSPNLPMARPNTKSVPTTH
jgi:hypothetical protein